ncbi:hypothetical protein V3C99_003247 [Haemonchus contortus]
METEDGIAIVKPAHKGKLEPRSAGQLQCPTKKAASLFNCIFASKACTCITGLQKASCVCSSGNMENLMQEYPLPQASKNYLIYSHGDAVFAKTSVGSAIQLHLVAEDLKITTRQSNSSCEIEASDLSGCYNCMTGAELTLSCRSSHGQVTANILCPTQSQIAHCTKTGHLNKLKFHFSNSTDAIVKEVARDTSFFDRVINDISEMFTNFSLSTTFLKWITPLLIFLLMFLCLIRMFHICVQGSLSAKKNH